MSERYVRTVNGEWGKGRGETAVADMKARLAEYRNLGMDSTEIVDTLWDRHHKAVTGPGHTYEYAEA